MREMYTAMKLLYGCGLARKTALVTDGRFSGTNSGCFVGHVSPEAAEGGPLAIVEDGDTITIDIPAAQPSFASVRCGDPGPTVAVAAAAAAVHERLPGALRPSGRVGRPGAIIRHRIE